MTLYRSMMEAADGLPVIGPGGRLLGVRPGSSPSPDVLAIDDGDLVFPGGGGMSVAPTDPLALPKHRRPASLGGVGIDPVWAIEVDDLGPDIQFRQARSTHGVIEPSK